MFFHFFLSISEKYLLPMNFEMIGFLNRFRLWSKNAIHRKETKKVKTRYTNDSIITQAIKTTSQLPKLPPQFRLTVISDL
jgi:hypothetical protein